MTAGTEKKNREKARLVDSESLTRFSGWLSPGRSTYECFFINNQDDKSTVFFDDPAALAEKVPTFNEAEYTCYIGLNPRKAGLMKAGANDDVAALHWLPIDLDPIREPHTCATDQEKALACHAADEICKALEADGYQPPIKIDSGNGAWILVRIPEIQIDDSNRDQVQGMLKGWGQHIRERFQFDGVDIDSQVYDLRRLIKVPGTIPYNKTASDDRPIRPARIISTHDPIIDERFDAKNLEKFLSHWQGNRTRQPQSSSPIQPDRIIEKCPTLAFFKQKADRGTSLPHPIRLALSSFADAVTQAGGNGLEWIEAVIRGCPDYDRDKTINYLRMNAGKTSPYGCGKLQELAETHFSDFDKASCDCKLPITKNQDGSTRKPSPVRFMHTLPDDLHEIFSSIDWPEHGFDRFQKIQQTAQEIVADVGPAALKSFLNAERKEHGLTKQEVNELVRDVSTAEGQDTGEPRLTDLCYELILSKSELWHDSAFVNYATVENNNHHENWPLKSSGFSDWVQYQFRLAYHRGLSKTTQGDAIFQVGSYCRYEGGEHEAHIRVGGTADAVYIDLCNKQWEAIEITQDGWNVVSNPAIKFKRTPGMLELPYPVKGGNLELLRPFLNLENDDEWVLMVAWLVMCARYTGPFPVLVLEGQQGSSKSMTSRILRECIDPHKCPLRHTPREVRDLMIAAQNSRICAFDNISNLKDWLSDTLCSLSTGAGDAGRTLYSNDEETLFQAMRPTCVNGIDQVTSRGDLVSRSMVIQQKPIDEFDRKLERHIMAKFEVAKPQILGAICDAVQGALKHESEISVERLPRMADFAFWSLAAQAGGAWPGYDFLEIYNRNQAEAININLNQDPVAEAVLAFMEYQQKWEGTASELLDALGDIAGEKTCKLKTWPKQPHILSGRLKRSAPFLKAQGIEIENKGNTGKSRKRIIEICKISPECNKTSGSVRSVHLEKNDVQPAENTNKKGRTLRENSSVHQAFTPGSKRSPLADDLEGVNASTQGVNASKNAKRSPIQGNIGLKNQEVTGGGERLNASNASQHHILVTPQSANFENGVNSNDPETWTDPETGQAYEITIDPKTGKKIYRTGVEI